jgi:hypothetical protein
MEKEKVFKVREKGKEKDTGKENEICYRVKRR